MVAQRLAVAFSTEVRHLHVRVRRPQLREANERATASFRIEMLRNEVG
jgi:hypothetical protein